MAEITDILGLNPGSPTQLKKLLIDELGLPVVKTTKGGKASFDKFAMEQYEELLEQMGDSRASLILEYRGWQKTCSSNYKAYLELLSPDGRLRPNYKLHGTVTGRLSCEKPNLQQIPKVSEKPWNGSLKRAFIPREGYKLFEGDYSQIEFRLAAAYGREESLLAIFNDPTRDIFTEMAATLGMPRNSVKTLTYTIQFGGGVNRIKQVFGVTEQEARAMLDNYWNSYRGIYKVTQLAKSKAMRTGKVKLWSGRTRKFLYPEDEARKAFNSAIQGGAADIVKRAMVRLYNTVDNDDCQMLLQVHDSVVFEIREGTEDKYLPLIKETMEAVEPDFGVHFAVDVHEWGK
jgi:DNA polymerase-1